MRKFLLLYFILSCGKTTAPQPLICNGHAEFCDKPYNHIAQANSHNATSYLPSLVQNQDRSLAEQLTDGIRVLKIPIHYDYANRIGFYDFLMREYLKELNEKIDQLISKKNAAAALLHEKQQDITSKILNLAKKTQKFFIEQNPQLISLKIRKALLEVALKVTENHSERTIFSCHGLAKNELYKNYIDQKFIDQLVDSAPKIIRPAVKAIFQPLEGTSPKLMRFLYGESQEAGRIFPYPACLLDTSSVLLKDFLNEIREFLDSHPNEVITILLNDFVKNDHDLAKIFEESGIIHYAHAQNSSNPWPTFKELIQSSKRLIVFSDAGNEHLYPWINNRNFYDAWRGNWSFTSTEKFTDPNVPLSEFGNFSYRDIQAPQNKIFDVHYVVTPGLAGSKKAASIINEASIFRIHMKQLAEAAQHIPNWISIDFYEYPKHDIFDVIDELNGVGKYAGKPLWAPAAIGK